MRRGGMLEGLWEWFEIGDVGETRFVLYILRSVLSESRVSYLHSARVKLEGHITPLWRCICQKHMSSTLHTSRLASFVSLVSNDNATQPLLTRISKVADSAMPSPLKSLPRMKHRIWPLLVLLVLVHLSTVLYTLPLNRVIEARLCQEYYELQNPISILPDSSIPEKLCKISEVQRKLAWLQGIMETTLVVCGMSPVQITGLSLSINADQTSWSRYPSVSWLRSTVSKWYFCSIWYREWV